jgi:putative FmdB family regulatory protein
VPTYQYACTSCGDRLEVVQKFSDDPLTECPTCHGALRKVFSPVGVVFKGSGFYKTDSRSSRSSSTAGSGSGTSSTESAPAASGADSGSTPSTGDAGGSTSNDKKPSTGDKVA